MPKKAQGGFLHQKSTNEDFHILPRRIKGSSDQNFGRVKFEGGFLTE